jgi:SulP family sulfate permease
MPLSPATLFTLFTPFLRWWNLVDRGSLRADLMAGLTGAVIVLPQGVAFAMIAGLPPEYGLYTAIVPAIVAALFGSSHHLISGPTTAISIVVFSTLSPLAEPGSMEFVQLALTLTLIAGLFQFILGLANLGTLVNFVSHTVVVGFTAGAAILIATSQLKHFFGVHIPSGESFLHTWMDLFARIPDINPYVVVVSASTLAIAILFKIVRPRWPGMLIAMVAGSLIAAMLGAESHDIALVGSLPASLPPLSMPEFSFALWKELAPGALAIAMLGLVEAVSIARSVASRSQQRIDGNQEFVGQGLANMVGSFFSSYASSGSFTRTGVNYTAGARTPMAAIFAAISLALVLLLIAPLTAYLPIPAMAGVLLLVAFNLIDFKHIQEIFRVSRPETAVLATTFFATLFLHLEFAIYVGVILSLTLYLKRTSRPEITTLAPNWDERKHPLINTSVKPAKECPQLRILRLDGSLFFGAVNHLGGFFSRHAEERPEQRNVLVVGNAMNFIDLAGAELLEQEANRLRTKGGNLYLCNLKTRTAKEAKKLGLTDQIESFDSKPEAIQAIFLKLDRERCKRCQHRIFFECDSLPPPPE